MSRLRASCLVVLAALAVSMPASTRAWEQSRQALPSSPFAADGPLAPWVGPLPPRDRFAPQLDSMHPPAVASPLPASPMGPTPVGQLAMAPAPDRGAWDAGSSSTSHYPLTADRPAEPEAHDGTERQTYVAATLNPALSVVGKTSGRLEVAPLAAHAIFGEVSKLALYVDDVSRTVSGTELDIGYHLYPQGGGARGFYIGPRYMFGSGEIPEAQWEFTGWGADFGYQFVIANHLVLNLGGGIARVEGSATIRDDLVDGLLDGLPEEQAEALGSLSTQSRSFWVPLLTLGLGLAI